MDNTQTNNPPLPLGQKGQQIVIDSKLARFFIMHRKEGSFATVSPFLIHRCITNVLGEVKLVKKLRSGDLLIEVANSKQASQIMRCYMFKDIPVVVSAHGSLNFSRGVISEGELLHVSEEEILDGLKEQHVCGVRRITIRRDKQILPTKHLILTFDSPTLPSHIKAGYLRCPVRPFVPNPLRCFKCQRFGHSKASCRGSVTCPRCAEVGHDGEGCQEALQCANCKGDHAAFSRTCPKWMKEKEIQVLKVRDNMPYPEARKLVERRTPQAGLSYAAALKSFSTIATQTDAIIPGNNRAKVQTQHNSKTNIPSSNSQNSRKDRTSNPKSSKSESSPEHTKKSTQAASQKSPPVGKPAPLSVKNIIKQRPLNPAPSTSSEQLPKHSIRHTYKRTSKVKDASGWTTVRNPTKYEKKRLKTFIGNYSEDPNNISNAEDPSNNEDPALIIQASDLETDEESDEMEVTAVSSSSSADELARGNDHEPG